MSVAWVSAADLLEAGRSLIRPARYLVEVGPGAHPFDMPGAVRHYLVEPSMSAWEALFAITNNDSRYCLLTSDWMAALWNWPEGAVDSVLALDVIEHLLRIDGASFIEKAQRLARRQVVIFTPLGPMTQESDNPWQRHRSAWTPEDFGADWEIIACKDFHSSHEPPCGAFWAIWNREEQS